MSKREISQLPAAYTALNTEFAGFWLILFLLVEQWGGAMTFVALNDIL